MQAFIIEEAKFKTASAKKMVSKKSTCPIKRKLFGSNEIHKMTENVESVSMIIGCGSVVTFKRKM